MKGKQSPSEEHKEHPVITKLDVTTDTITSRGGLNLLVKYLDTIGVYSLLLSRFGWFRKSRKGAAIETLFRQILCFFFDGTSSHVSYFDHLKRDEGYAAIIETAHDKMVSSHQVKRFFSRFSFVCSKSFRWILKGLFLWRLLIENPSLLIFTLDTQVLDNDDALKRQGVSVSYKRKKGFQPLHLLWNGKIIDALFRGGSTHGNNGQGARTMLTEMVRFIRKHYSQSVPIWNEAGQWVL